MVVDWAVPYFCQDRGCCTLDLYYGVECTGPVAQFVRVYELDCYQRRTSVEWSASIQLDRIYGCLYYQDWRRSLAGGDGIHEFYPIVDTR